MENAGYEGDAEKSMEMSEVKTISGQVTNSHPQSIPCQETLEKPVPNSCNVAMCREMHSKYLQDKSKVPASPWHRLKTVFLLGIIAILTAWVLLYGIFTWLELL